MTETFFRPTAPVAAPLSGSLEQSLAAVLVDDVGAELVSPDAHFFDLGAGPHGHEPLLRPGPKTYRPAVGVDQGGLPALDGPRPGDLGHAGGGPRRAGAAGAGSASGPRRLGARTGEPTTLRVVGKPAAPDLPGLLLLAGVVLTRGYEWISTGTGAAVIYLRSVLFGTASFVGMFILPVLVKWMLVGRWKLEEIRAWNLAHLRFWVVRMLVRGRPMALFAASPRS